MKSKDTYIYIFTTEQFPNGYAATNRIISYARGFLHHRKKVMVVCFEKTETTGDVQNKSVNGVYRDIPFTYLAKSTVKADSFLKKKLEALMMNVNLFLFSISHLTRNSFSIYYASHTSSAIILRITSWIKGSVLLKEENEHPSIRVSARGAIPKFIFNKLHYDLFDGLLLITNNLIDYFKNELHSAKPMLHVKMVVDIERFELENIQRKKVITYCGILNDAKDGIGILIRAFARICPRFPEYKLVLIGNVFYLEDQQKYIRMVADLNITDRVIFKGNISNDLVPALLMEASVLVLARPDSVQARQGFPTKLGEYLATGNPVITTSVGEIPLYLKDGVNAFLAEPGSMESLAEKFVEILENEESSKKIGENGRKTTFEYFSNITQTKEILDFFDQFG